jgi:hypothetical protein
MKLNAKKLKKNMKKSKKTVALLLLGFAFTAAQAQQASTASGGDALGSGGSAAYSVGQIVYTANTANTGSVAQGVQQAFEISIVTGIKNETKTSMLLAVFPNPTTNFLNLQIADLKTEQLTYQLTDALGKLIIENKIFESSTQINMNAQVEAIYFLNIIKNNQTVKTFKIIKN